MQKEIKELLRLSEVLEQKTRAWQNDLENDLMAIRAFILKVQGGIMEGANDECVCSKCGDAVKCEHDGDTHIMSLCANCIG